MLNLTKHVLVLDCPQASGFLGQQGLSPQHGGQDAETNPEADSCAPTMRPRTLRDIQLDETNPDRWDGISDLGWGWNKVESLTPDELLHQASIRNPALSSRDGIQFYCFRGRQPYNVADQNVDPDGIDPNHLEYWMRRLDEKLTRSEKLDAIVIPSCDHRTMSYLRLKPFLEKMKAKWPDVQVLVVEPSITHPHKAGVDGRESHYLIGHELKPRPGKPKETVTVTPNTPEFALGKLIDRAIKQPQKRIELANTLRNMLDMPQLKEQDAGEGYVANKKSLKKIRATERGQRARAKARRDGEQGPQGRG